MSDGNTLRSRPSREYPAFPPPTQDGQLPTEVSQLLRLCDLYYGEIHTVNDLSFYGSDRDEQRDRMWVVSKLYSVINPMTAFGTWNLGSLDKIREMTRTWSIGSAAVVEDPYWSDEQIAEACREKITQYLHTTFVVNVDCEAEYSLSKKCKGFTWSNPISEW